MSAELQNIQFDHHVMDVDLETIFDITEVVGRLTKRQDKLPGVEISYIETLEVLPAETRRVLIGGPLFEDGLAFEFWDELAKIQERPRIILEA